MQPQKYIPITNDNEPDASVTIQGMSQTYLENIYLSHIYVSDLKNINTYKIIESINIWKTVLEFYKSIQTLLSHTRTNTYLDIRKLEDETHSIHNSLWHTNQITQNLKQITYDLEKLQTLVSYLENETEKIIRKLELTSQIYESVEKNLANNIHAYLQTNTNFHTNMPILFPLTIIGKSKLYKYTKHINTISDTLHGKTQSNGQENLWVSTQINSLSTLLSPVLSQIPHGQKLTSPNEKLTATQHASLVLGTIMNKHYQSKHGIKNNILIRPDGNKLKPQTINTIHGTGKTENKTPHSNTHTMSDKKIKNLTAQNLALRIKQLPSNPDTGAFEIIKHERINNNQKTNSWSVIIRGTQRWDGASSNIQDQVTNFNSLGKADNDQYRAIIKALQMSKIKPNEPVEFVGHSQGGLIATQLVSSQQINKQYNITTLTTFGSPTGGYKIPSNIHALHFENLSDPVPGLDGKPNQTTTNRTTIYMDTRNMKIQNSTHDQVMYSIAAKNIEKHQSPHIQKWVKSREIFMHPENNKQVTHKSYSQLFNTTRF